jgi:hypothetical protein
MTEQIKKTVYVVTRNSRRIEERNYASKEDAESRAQQLVTVLKTWKDPDQNKVRVVKTDRPTKIR